MGVRNFDDPVRRDMVGEFRRECRAVAPMHGEWRIGRQARAHQRKNTAAYCAKLYPMALHRPQSTLCCRQLELCRRRGQQDQQIKAACVLQSAVGVKINECTRRHLVWRFCNQLPAKCVGAGNLVCRAQRFDHGRKTRHRKTGENKKSGGKWFRHGDSTGITPSSVILRGTIWAIKRNLPASKA